MKNVNKTKYILPLMEDLKIFDGLPNCRELNYVIVCVVYDRYGKAIKELLKLKQDIGELEFRKAVVELISMFAMVEKVFKDAGGMEKVFPTDGFDRLKQFHNDSKSALEEFAKDYNPDFDSIKNIVDRVDKVRTQDEPKTGK